MSSPSPSAQSTMILDVFGSLGALSAFTVIPGISAFSLSSIPSQISKPDPLRLEIFPSQPGRLTESDDSGHVLGSGSPVALVSPSREDRLERRRSPDIERAHSLRTMDLVRGHRIEMHSEGLHVDRYLPGSLHPVGMKPDPGFFGDPADLGDRLDRPDFVVRMHDRHQQRVCTNGGANIVRVDPSLPVDRDSRNLKTLRFEIPRGSEHRRMLDLGGDDMASVGSGRACDAPKREIIGFRTAAEEDDFRKLGSHESTDLGAGIVQSRLGPLSEVVDRGCVAVVLGEERLHGLDDFRPGTGRGIVVEIDVLHGRYGPFR